MAMKEALLEFIALSAWSPYSELNCFHRWLVEKPFAILDVATIYAKVVAAAVLPYFLFFAAEWGFAGFCLVAWSASELIFYGLQVSCLNSLSLRLPSPLVDDKERLDVAQQLAEHIVDAGLELKGWFRRSSPINLDQLETFSIHTFFDKLPGELSHEERTNVQEIVDIFQKRMGSSETPDHQETSVMFWPSLAPLSSDHRSIILYTGIFVVKSLGYLALSHCGFEFRSLNRGLSYWIHKPSYQETEKSPILFFHGIGFGPCQYISYLTHLQSMYPNRLIIAFTLPHITNAPFAEISSEVHALEAIDIMLQDNHIKSCSVVAHSFGTFVASWMMKWRRSYVDQITMLDPVCFMTWDSTLYQRVLFMEPQNVVHHISSRFIVRDPVFSSVMNRQMNWKNSLTFPELFDCPTNIFLSKKDWVIDSPGVYRYLQDRKVRSSLQNLNVTLLDITHMEFMFDGELCDMINSKV